jgi:hypothetical protein
MAQMSDDDLLSQLENMERQAVGYYGGEIAGEQSKAMDYYLSKPFGTEEEGRSRVVSSDVWDVVEGLTPLVAKTFFASDDLVTFNPVGPEDEEAAQQETAYVNHIVVQKNDSFNEIISAIKTGLLQKNATAKYWWEKSKRSTIERYQGLSDDQYALLIKDDDVTVIQHTEQQAPAQPAQPDPNAPPGQPEAPAEPVTTHDCVIRVSHEVGEPKYCVLPPEEIRVSRDAQSTNPKKARYVGHITKKTISEIREMGYDVDDDIEDFNSQDPYLSEQYLARRMSEEAEYSTLAPLDPSMREVTFSDAVVRIDFDGDGIAELRRVCKVGRKILLNEETEEVNYVSWTPYPQPFKFYGRCPADETVEIQLIKSTLWRQSLDNIYTINNNRVYASDSVNLDDLLDNQIAGVVRVKAGQTGVSNHVMQAEITPIGGVVQPMIEYLDSAKENRTGFSRYNQGSADLGNQKTLGEVQIVSEQSGQRVELIARAFAEQFMKPLMLGIHGLCQRHATKAETVRIRDKWVTIDPREWQTRDDMTISVGLGNADQRMKMQAAQMILGEQQKLIAIPGVVTPENLFNAAAKLAQSVGEKSPEKYFSDPSKAPPVQPPDPMQDPHFMLEVAKSKQADRKLDLEEKFRTHELAIQDRDSVINGLVAAGNMEANIAKAINEPTLMSHLERVQTQLGALQSQAASDSSEDGQDPAEEASEAPQAAPENPAPPQIGMGAQPAPAAPMTGAPDGQA